MSTELILLSITGLILSPAVIFAIVHKFNKKKLSIEEIREDLNADFNISPSECLSDCPDIIGWEEGVKGGWERDKVTQMQVLNKKVVKIPILPSVKIAKDKLSFIVQFSNSCSPSALIKYTDYIGEQLYKYKHIPTPNISANVSPNPFIINYKILPPKEKLDFKYIDESKEKFETFIYNKINKDKAQAFFGYLRDDKYQVPGLMIDSLAASPHILIAGATRSGKTKTACGFITTLAATYPESRGYFYFCDGKDGQDWDLFAQKLSPFKCGKIPKGDVNNHFANIMLAVWNEYQRRITVAEQAANEGIICSTYLEMNKKSKELNRPELFMPRLFLMIDEFAVYVTNSEDTVNNLITTTDSPFYYLKRLLKEGASKGITVILASQEPKVADFGPFKPSLTTWMIHTVGPDVAKYLELEGIVETQAQGEFILKYPGIKDSEKGEIYIPCKYPYVGDEPEYIRDNFKDYPKNEFDLDLIYPRTSKTEDLEKLDKLELFRYIGSCFLKRENFTISYKGNPKYDYILYQVIESDKTINIGIVEKEELTEEFFSRLNRMTSSEILKNKTYWFVIGSVNAKAQVDIQSLLDSTGDEAIYPQDWNRLLSKGYELYKTKNVENVFRMFLGSKKTQLLEVQKTIEVKEENSRKDVKISLEELDRISALPGNTDNQKETKGVEFELFVHALFAKLGYKVFSPGFLFATKLYGRPGDVGDLGLDALFVKSTKSKLDLRNLSTEESDSRIAVQIKNWSQDLPAKVLGEVLRSQQNFKCLTTGQPIKNGMVVMSGEGTSYTELEAKNAGIKLIGRKELRQLIRDLLNTKQESKEPTLEDEKSKILKFKAEGLSNRAIASNLGISASKVDKIMRAQNRG
ncbi:MAG: restriction endonuclease [Bdellovibrionales bacterium]|nr:restriction endonuclease [Bdellovibrionales bacterium]